jgi:hypothetical protein
MADLDDISISRWGRFTSPAMESAYQAAELHPDWQRAKYMLWLICLGAVFFLPFDYVFFGNTYGFYVSIALRIVILTFNAVMLYVLRRHLTPARLEGWLIGLCVSLTFMVLFGYAHRPVERMNHPLNILLILLFAVALPMRFSHQMFIAGAYTVASNIILVRRHSDPVIEIAFLIVSLFTLALGYFTAQSFHRIRRQRFAAHQSEVQLRLQLESALTEIKTLQGLLPICAACKKIRQDDGMWRNVEEYISAHTDTQFTHGICPECRAQLYPKYS